MPLNAYLDWLSPDIVVAMEINKAYMFKVSVNSSGVLAMGSSSLVKIVPCLTLLCPFFYCI
jgi:hypothetical protein